LKYLTSQETIKAPKKDLVTDCGARCISKEFENFAKSYNFEHGIVSPKHQAVNGQAEAAVKDVKPPWRKNKGKNKARLEF